MTQEGRRLVLAERGMAGEVATRRLPAPIRPAAAGPGRRTHAWANQYGKLRWWTERRRVLVGFWLAMAAAAIVCGRPGGNVVDVQVQIASVGGLGGAVDR